MWEIYKEEWKRWTLFYFCVDNNSGYCFGIRRITIQVDNLKKKLSKDGKFDLRQIDFRNLIFRKKVIAYILQANLTLHRLNFNFSTLDWILYPLRPSSSSASSFFFFFNFTFRNSTFIRPNEHTHKLENRKKSFYFYKWKIYNIAGKWEKQHDEWIIILILSCS